MFTKEFLSGRLCWHFYRYRWKSERETFCRPPISRFPEAIEWNEVELNLFSELDKPFKRYEKRKNCKHNFFSLFKPPPNSRIKKAKNKIVEIFAEWAERISRMKIEILARAAWDELFDFPAFGCQVKLKVLRWKVGRWRSQLGKLVTSLLGIKLGGCFRKFHLRDSASMKGLHWSREMGR